MTAIENTGEAPAQPQTTGRVVVGIDGSPGSLEALRYAAAVARWKGWTLHLIGAWHVVYPIAPYGIECGDLIAAAQETAVTSVRDAEKLVLGDDVTVEVRRSIEEGPPAKILVDTSKGADLLVVGNRGLGGFSSLLLGSVSQACVHHAHCPVLVVRPTAEEAAS
jgi:nucleotide-binding universal stress UspA family protein